MALLGTIVNSALIIIGSLIGLCLSNISESMKNSILKGIGLTVMVLGLQMALQTSNFLLIIISLVIGIVIGEVLDLDGKLNQAGKWLELKIGNRFKGQIAQGFISGTLIFVIGAMAILGALDSGIRNNHEILYTKGFIDGFTAIILTTTLGIGVIFSSVSVFIYQGTIALFATFIDSLIPNDLMKLLISEITAIGGIMIVAIGLNLVEITKIKVANFLPGILVIIAIVPFIYYLT